MAAIDVTETARATGAGQVEQEVVAQPGQVLALELADGTTVYTSPERLEQTMRQVAPDSVRADGSIDLEMINTRGGEATRDIVGAVRRIFSRVTTLDVGSTSDVIIDEARKKLQEWVGGKIAGEAGGLGVSWLGTKALMWAIESRLSRKPGLYRWIAAEGEPTDLFSVGDQRLVKETQEGTILVFIHGTASSTVGSYADLQNASRDYWRTLTARYGERIYAFEHRTMSESPIENALQLARALPARARLHLVTHSRGGLVGDLLCLDALASGDSALVEEYTVDDLALGDTPKGDRERVRKELHQAYSEHRERLRELGAVLREKQFVVERYVRVASPARGTRLASGNLDVFLSGLLTLVGLVPALAGQPIYSAFKRAVLEIVKNRTRPNLVPGIEAMLPESPIARLLARATPSETTQLAIIAGDIQGGGLLKRLGVLFTDHVFFNGGDNDLVVDTDSMYAGTARPGRARALFDQGADVSHFRYFANDEMRRALSRWLLEPNLAGVTEFLAIGTGDGGGGDDGERWAGRRSRGGDAVRLPVVVVLPGIMGSHLWLRGKHRVWLNFADLVTGGLDRIAFGKPNVEAERVYDLAYGDLCVHLANTHQVEPHPYDWRQPMEVLADALALRLGALLKQTRDPQRPVRLLAHSMGGLVVRAMAHKYPDLWKQVMDREGSRFVMLGTPNRGSHSMVETLIGKNESVRKLAVVDLRHDMQRVLDLVGEFPGALQLLPSSGLPDPDGATWDYYESAPWQTLRQEVRDPWFGDGVVAVPSAKALAAGRWLWDQDVKHGTRLAPYKEKITYVHGMAAVTAAGVKKVKDRWKMLGTLEGDGTVTWESGRIDGIGRYFYMPAEHGALADTAEYFSSIESLLLTDDPGTLMTTPPVSRGAQAEPIEYDAGPPVYPSESELGLELVGRRKRGRARPRALPSLRVCVRAGDLRDCSKPILVGHYEHDAISGAEALIDTAVVDGALTVRYNLGMYAGPLGTATVVLKSRNQAEITRGSYRGAVVTGLGKYDGTLGVNALTEAVRTAALRFLLHIYDATDGQEGNDTTGVPLATLLLGYNSSANLSIADSVGAMLRGVIDANRKFRASFQSRLSIDELEIIELYVDTAISTGYALTKVAASINAEVNVGCRVDAAAEINATDSMRHRLEDSRAAAYWPRLHISDADRHEDDCPPDCSPSQNASDGDDDPRDGRKENAMGASPEDGSGDHLLPVPNSRLPGWIRRGRGMAERLKFLYVGQRARAETVVEQRQPGLVDRLVAQQLHIHAYNQDFSRTLFQLLVPHDFKDAARQLDQVVLVLDSYTANLPWELMLAGDKPLAVSTALVRQLSSTRFRIGVRQATERRAYVIGNPSVEGFARAFPNPAVRDPKDPPSLPAAEHEAIVVTDVLSQYGFDVTRSIGNDQPALDVVNRLYKHPYRVLHIAAHGVFEERHVDGMARTGVVLSNGLLITAAEVCAMEVVPDLVFLNCCHLGQVNHAPVAFNRLAYSISRELIEMGVRAVVAAGWAVDDEAASLFAETFYREMLAENNPFGDAVFAARQRVWDVFPTSITWGAYQAYGDPMWRMEPRRDGSDGRARSGEWIPVAPEELIARIEQKRVQLRRMKAVLLPSEAQSIAASVEKLLRGRPKRWLERLDVLAALGALYGDMGKEYFEKAVEYYRQVVREHDTAGRAPVSAIEQLANLEARAGEYRDDDATIRAAIRRLQDLGTLVLRNAKEEAEQLTPATANRQRRGLLGSAYKRLAAVHARRSLRAKNAKERDDELAEMNEALDESMEWYGGPVESLENERKRDKEIDLYTATNRIFHEVLARTKNTAAAIDLARECGRLVVAEVGLDANYWSSTTRADVFLAESLLDGSFDDADAERVERAAKQYGDAHTGVLVGPKSLDSTVQQLCLMSLFLSTRANAMSGAKASSESNEERRKLLNIASALRQVAERLVPGACDFTVPARSPDEPESKQGAAAGRKRRTKRTAGDATTGDDKAKRAPSVRRGKGKRA